jgi:hypothetical protein
VGKPEEVTTLTGMHGKILLKRILEELGVAILN